MPAASLAVQQLELGATDPPPLPAVKIPKSLAYSQSVLDAQLELMRAVANQAIDERVLDELQLDTLQGRLEAVISHEVQRLEQRVATAEAAQAEPLRRIAALEAELGSTRESLQQVTEQNGRMVKAVELLKSECAMLRGGVAEALEKASAGGSVERPAALAEEEPFGGFRSARHVSSHVSSRAGSIPRESDAPRLRSRSRSPRRDPTSAAAVEAREIDDEAREARSRAQAMMTELRAERAAAAAAAEEEEEDEVAKIKEGRGAKDSRKDALPAGGSAEGRTEASSPSPADADTPSDASLTDRWGEALSTTEGGGETRRLTWEKDVEAAARSAAATGSLVRQTQRDASRKGRGLPAKLLAGGGGAQRSKGGSSEGGEGGEGGRWTEAQADTLLENLEETQRVVTALDRQLQAMEGRKVDQFAFDALSKSLGEMRQLRKAADASDRSILNGGWEVAILEMHAKQRGMQGAFDAGTSPPEHALAILAARFCLLMPHTPAHVLITACCAPPSPSSHLPRPLVSPPLLFALRSDRRRAGQLAQRALRAQNACPSGGGGPSERAARA